MSDRGLVGRTVAAFVEAVASVEEPVPAGGSVAALSGSGAAALLELVCGVLERKGHPRLETPRVRAAGLKIALLDLVDADAAAYHTFVRARRAQREQPDSADACAALDAAAAHAVGTPLAIAKACLDVLDLASEITADVKGALQGDVLASRHLAAAAGTAALDLADQDIPGVSNDQAQQALRADSAKLRARLTRPTPETGPARTGR
ncbi:MAG: hypothetical protein NVSMB2_16330 [Chloroflexota bacterium]